MERNREPIAKVLVLAGPTHYQQPLPDAGPTDFRPGASVPIYTAEDLEAAKRLPCAGQCKIRPCTPGSEADPPVPEVEGPGPGFVVGSVPSGADRRTPPPTRGKRAA